MTSAPLRWLLMATHVPAGGQGGGIVRYTTEIAEALNARPDIELHVLTSPPAAGFFVGLLGDARRLHVLPRLPRLAMALVERIGVRLTPWRQGFDVIQGTKHLLPRGVQGTLVLTAHDMLLVDRPGDFDPVKRRLLRRPYLSSLREADVIVSVSAATAARVEAWLPRVHPAITVVPLATSTALRTVAPVPVAALDGSQFALVVGDPSPRKNLPVVVESWPQVCAAVPEAVLAVVGPDSWGQTRYGRVFEALVAQGKVVRLPNIDDARLRWCYEQASVVLCPSLAEGFGLPAAEALDLGATLITSEDAALTEVSGNRARHVPAARGDLWVEAITAAMREGKMPTVASPPRTRSWGDVAEETVAAVTLHRTHQSR